VAMNTETLERDDLRPFIKERNLEWQVPNGTWKIMYFILVQEGRRFSRSRRCSLGP
jgi:hypothetical protein